MNYLKIGGSIAALLLALFIGNKIYSHGYQQAQIDHAEEQQKAYDKLAEKTKEEQKKLNARSEELNRLQANTANLMSRLRNETYSSPSASDVCFDDERLLSIQANSRAIRDRKTQTDSRN